MRELIELNHSYRAQLGGMRFIMREPLAKWVQPRLRGFLSRKKSKAQLRAVLRIQACDRSVLAVLSKRRCVRAATILQSRERSRRLRARLASARGVTTVFNSLARRFLATNRFARSKASAITIQTHVRGARPRATFQQQKAALIRIKES